MLIAGLASVIGWVTPVAAATPAGCDGLPPALAYHPGGAPVSPKPSNSPQPCGVSTGFAAAESHIVATLSGTIVYTPAVLPSGVLGTGEGAPASVEGNTQGNATPAGLALTSDRGAHWTMSEPDGVTWNPTDHGDYVDPRTGRFFFEDYGPIPFAPAFGPGQEGPAHLMWTSDFHAWHHALVSNLVLPENPRFTSAAAPPGQAVPVGYPSVVYFCANTNVGFTTPAILGRLCFRSLDGGTTWSQRSEMLNALVPSHPECGAQGEVFSAVDGYYPEPTTDGLLYALVSCGGRTYLTRSSDEAATFPVVHTGSGPRMLNLPVDSITSLGSGPQLRIDSADNFYVVYPSMSGSRITQLRLIVSTNRGLTWSAPVNLTQPGVTSILRWAVAVRHPGQLALAFIGQHQGESTYDAYMTSTADANRGAQATLWSARTNLKPLLFADHIVGAGFIVGQGQVAVPFPFPLGIQPVAGPVVAGNDFIGVTIGPDGTAWGSFDQDCGPAPSAAGCMADKDQTRGFVASLTAPSPGQSPPPAPRPGPSLPATGASQSVPAIGVALAFGALALVHGRRRGRHLS